MTQRQLAALLGVNGSTVSRWEKRETQIPDQRKDQIALILGVTQMQLMGWDLNARAYAAVVTTDGPAVEPAVA